MTASLDITGLFPPIPTPFREDEEIDFERLKSNLQKWDKYDFAGM